MTLESVVVMSVEVVSVSHLEGAASIVEIRDRYADIPMAIRTSILSSRVHVALLLTGRLNLVMLIVMLLCRMVIGLRTERAIWCKLIVMHICSAQVAVESWLTSGEASL